jgi:hypothetical protein
MPSLRDKSHDGVLCTFSNRTSATAAEFAGSSQLSSHRPGQAVRFVMEGPSITTQILPRRVTFMPGGPPCWVISLAFGLIGSKIWGSAMYQRSYQIFFLMGLIAGGKSTRENYCAAVAHVCNMQCSILNTKCLFI